MNRSSGQTIKLSQPTEKRRPGRRNLRAIETPVDARSKLIEVGLELFGTNGFHATSTRQITDAANVNVSLIKYYFETKEGLYKACLDCVRDNHLTTIVGILSPASNLSELQLKLEKFLEQSLTLLVERPHVSRLIARSVQEDFENSGLADAVMPLAIGPVSHLVEFFSQAREAKLLRSDIDPGLLAMTVSGFIWHHAIVDGVREKLDGRSIKSPELRRLIAQSFASILVEGIRLSPELA